MQLQSERTLILLSYLILASTALVDSTGLLLPLRSGERDLPRVAVDAQGAGGTMGSAGADQAEPPWMYPATVHEASTNPPAEQGSPNLPSAEFCVAPACSRPSELAPNSATCAAAGQEAAQLHL